MIFSNGGAENLILNYSFCEETLHINILKEKWELFRMYFKSIRKNASHSTSMECYVEF